MSVSEKVAIVAQLAIAKAQRETQVLVRGPKGDRGPQGLRGEIGPQGERGPQGLRGEMGPAGRDGVDGRDGADGVNGAPGRDGRDGKAGRDGQDGEPGLVWRGRWDAKVTYAKGDAVFFTGSSWIATGPSRGQIPSSPGTPWDLLAQSGSAGADGADGASGGAGGASFNFVQSTPSDTWVINHLLGYRPAIELFTVGGAEFQADILHTSDNQAIVYLAAPFAGSARCV